MDTYLAVMHEVHILYVDHEFNGTMNSTRLLLETCQYRVTQVDLAADAMVMLSNGKVKFDFIIADINSPDLHGFRLLQLAVTMGIPIIMMSIADDMMMAAKIIEIGAFLYIRRPTTPEMLRCLWQHVARENMRLMREHDRLMASNYTTPPRIDHSGDIYPNNVGANNAFVMKETTKFKGRHLEEEYDLDDSNMTSCGRVIKRKVCTEWTQELHEKFMDAVMELGEGKCFPREILALMNVPGLTRMQVASHLQKCRNENWRSPVERKASRGMNPMSSDGEEGNKPRIYGYMPRLVKAKSDHEVYGLQASGGGQGSGPKMASEIVLMGNQTSYHQHYNGALVAHPNNSINSSNPSHLSSATDQGFFTLDMDCVIQNISGLPQPFAGMNPPQSSSRSFPLEPVYDHDQTNSKGASIESGSQWTTSSETSNDYKTNAN